MLLREPSLPLWKDAALFRSEHLVLTLLVALTWRIPEKDHAPITEAGSSITEMLQMISGASRGGEQTNEYPHARLSQLIQAAPTTLRIRLTVIPGMEEA